MRARLAQAYVSLDLERAAAKREGLPLGPADLPSPVVADKDNAAPYALALSQAQKKIPLPKQIEALRRTGPRTSADFDAVARLFAVRPQLLAPTHDITSKPGFSLHRTWTLRELDGPYLPSIAGLREAAYFLRLESLLMAHRRRIAEAVRNQALGFHVANLAASEAGLIPLLVGRACEGYTLDGMQEILTLSGPDASIDSAIVKAIASHPILYDVTLAIKAEALEGVMRFQKMGPTAPAHPESPKSATHHVSNGELLSKPRLNAAMLAEYLRRMRLVLKAAESPDPLRNTAMDELRRIQSGRTPDSPADLMADKIVPFLPAVLKIVRQAEAKRNVTLAAAYIMLYKARHGSYPERLSDAVNPTLRDPFSGGELTYAQTADSFEVSSSTPGPEYDAAGSTNRTVPAPAHFTYPDERFIVPSAEPR